MIRRKALHIFLTVSPLVVPVRIQFLRRPAGYCKFSGCWDGNYVCNGYLGAP